MVQRIWKFTVASPEEGLHLDQVLAARTGCSRRKVREALTLGGVQVDAKRVRVASRMLKVGMNIRMSLDDTLGAPPDMDLDILFEDPWLLVLNKPAGLPSQGTQASDKHDLMALLARKRPGEKFHLQHRLDTGTSGVILLAKAGANLVGQAFQERRILKTYLARTTVPVAPCVVEEPVGKRRGTQPVRWGCSGDLLEPKAAITDFRPAEVREVEGLTTGNWVVASPRTGRTHQIRVHLAFLGSPILGDTLYGGAPDTQMWLHAWMLELEHPITGQSLKLVAPPTRFVP